MIAAVVCIALGGVTFEQVEIPDLYVAPPSPITGVSFGGFLHADLNHDGFNDVVLPDRVYFCSSAGLDPDSFISMPDVPMESVADVWDDQLYVLAPSYLGVFEYGETEWRETLRVEHEWTTDDGFDSKPKEGDAAITLTPMLHDVDGDGRPEILRIDQAGIAVAAIRENRLDIANLDVFPAASVEPTDLQPTLWPKTERRLAIPNRRTAVDVSIRGRAVTTLESHVHNTFEITQFEIVGGGDDAFILKRQSSRQTMSFPRYDMVPFPIRGGDGIGFVGNEVTWPTLKEWKPLVEGYISTDGGLTVERAASRGFNPRSVIVDLDGDGDLDWLGEESGLVMGGMRETANRALFQRAFSHTILARLQHADGTFDAHWRELGTIEIELDRPARHYTYRCSQYLQGELIDCTGDYNGDGWRDLAVVDRPELLSVYLGGPEGFAVKAETAFTVPPHLVPIAVDIDGNGLDDIAGKVPGSGWASLVYLNRGDKG